VAARDDPCLAITQRSNGIGVRRRALLGDRPQRCRLLGGGEVRAADRGERRSILRLRGRLTESGQRVATSRDHPNFDSAGAEHADALGRGLGQVDDSPADKGSAVVDAHDDGTAIRQILHQDPGPKRKRAVRGRELAGIHLLAARSARVKCIPRGVTDLIGLGDIER